MHAINKTGHGDINSLFDENRLVEALQSDQTSVLSTLKSAVKNINEGLKQLYQHGAPVEEIVTGRAYLVDRVLTTLFEHYFAPIEQPVALIAVGGYGRGELHPASDIDLMLLLQDEEDERTRDAIEKFIMLLWDARLEIGACTSVASIGSAGARSASSSASPPSPACASLTTTRSVSE